jgi:hypothetical protein
VNRGSAKPFAKALGVTPERVDELVDVCGSWLDPTSAGLLPRLAALRAFARTGSRDEGAEPPVFSLIGHAWVSAEGAARALRRAIVRGPLRGTWNVFDTAADGLARQAVVAGFVVVEHDCNRSGCSCRRPERRIRNDLRERCKFGQGE